MTTCLHCVVNFYQLYFLLWTMTLQLCGCFSWWRALGIYIATELTVICFNRAMGAFFKAFAKTDPSHHAHFASCFLQCEKNVSRPSLRKLQQAGIPASILVQQQTNANNNFECRKLHLSLVADFVSGGQAGSKALWRQHITLLHSRFAQLYCKLW